MIDILRKADTITIKKGFGRGESIGKNVQRRNEKQIEDYRGIRESRNM